MGKRCRKCKGLGVVPKVVFVNWFKNKSVNVPCANCYGKGYK